MEAAPGQQAKPDVRRDLCVPGLIPEREWVHSAGAGHAHPRQPRSLASLPAADSPPCGDSEPCYNDTFVEQWAEKQAAPYLSAGVPAGSVVTYALADEPGWYWPAAMPNLSHPAVRADWTHYLTDVVGLPASDFGTASLSATPLSPGRWVGGQANSSLQQRRLFYWTSRYSAWRASQHFATSTKALEKAFQAPGMGIYVGAPALLALF